MRGKLPTGLSLSMSALALAVAVFASVQAYSASERARAVQRREKAVIDRYYPRLLKLYEKAGIKDPPAPENFTEFLMDSYLRYLESRQQAVEGQLRLGLLEPEVAKPRALREPAAPVLFLRLNDKGELFISHQDPIKGDDAIKRFLRDEADGLRREGKLESARVVIRAHKDVKYGEVVRVMDVCQRVGLSRIGLREMGK